MARQSSGRLHLVAPAQMSDETPRLLLVDDSAAGRQLREQLEQEFHITLVQSTAEALEALSELPYALMIVGVSCVGRDESNLWQQAIAHYPATVRVLLDAGQHASLTEAFTQARTHHWLSPSWDRGLIHLQLLRALEAYHLARDNRRLARDMHLERQRHSTVARQLFETREQLRRALHRAETDGLTGLHNVRHFNHILFQEFKRANRSSRPFSLVMVDVDKFKDYNDDFGHPAGDEALKTIARILRGSLRAQDTVARYGGEEFVILLPETPKAAAARVIENLRGRLKQTRPGPSWQRPLTASFGLAAFPEDACDAPQTLIEIADKALYLAKARGRDRIELSSLNTQNA